MSKTIQEINEKIKKGSVTVVTAEEMTRIVRSRGPKEAAAEVDVVTTGTFGAMCSSGAWLNFGHSDPPIKITKCRLNGVPGYGGAAAVDTYIGATQAADPPRKEYGGAHIIEALVRKEPIELQASSPGTDCYPRRRLRTAFTIDDLNQATMSNPRNAYQKYVAACNSGKRVLYTYMGRLQPEYGNVNYSGAGELSPLNNDPEYRTLGMGTRIFLCGAPGFIIGSGTQHSPQNGFGTLMVQGDLKRMSSRFLRAAYYRNYGSTLYVGIGIPIPVLDEDMALRTGVSDEAVVTSILDYSVPRRSRPVVRSVNYAELKSGAVEINGRKVRTTCLSSLPKAREIAGVLKQWIVRGEFLLTEPLENLSRSWRCAPMKPAEKKRGRAGIDLGASG